MKLIIPALFLFATNVAAIASEVPALQPSVKLKVVPGNEAGHYQVDVAVVNLATTASLASPMVLVKSGEAGSVQVDLPDEMVVKISIMVDGAAQRLSYQTQILDHDRVVSNSSAEVALK